MKTDHRADRNMAFGEWLYHQLEASVHFETDGWAIERVQRVQERLHCDRHTSERLEVKIPWLQQFTAFTAPGRYVYISRSLLELCRDDEMAAFVIAHEIAHHDLGHVNLFPEWLTKLTGSQIAPVLTAIFQILEARIYGPERECAADRHGLQLCVSAGYDPHRCLAIFDILEKYALDVGDVNIVFGPNESDDELADDAPFATKLRTWLWQRSRGYLPIRDRRQALENWLTSNQG